MNSMSDILSGKALDPTPPTEPAVVAEPVVAPPATETQTGEPSAPATQPPDGRPRDDAGRFAPKAGEPDPKPAVPPTAKPDPAHVPVAALQEERRRRQELERQLAEATRQPPPKPVDPPKRPELFEDPDAYRADLERTFDDRLANERLNWSELQARQVHGTEVVDKAFQAFGEIVQKNPALYQQVMGSQHPWDAVVQVVRKIEALNEIGDPMTFAQRKEAELRQRLRAEWDAEQASKAPPPPAAAPLALPTALGSVPSVAPRSSAPAWNGPTSLANVFQPRR